MFSVTDSPATGSASTEIVTSEPSVGTEVSWILAVCVSPGPILGMATLGCCSPLLSSLSHSFPPALPKRRRAP